MVTVIIYLYVARCSDTAADNISLGSGVPVRLVPQCVGSSIRCVREAAVNLLFFGIASA